MDHLKRVADEFSRQAQTFETYAEKTDDRPSRFQAALGEAARGHLLDVACGPGVVTAALAPGAASVVAFDATEADARKGAVALRQGRIGQRRFQTAAMRRTCRSRMGNSTAS